MKMNRWINNNKDVRNKKMDAALDVLVVDDDHEQAKITKMLIERNGFHSKFTTNGQEALEIIQTKTPRLVILDLMMP
ncbi:MAG TPA: response regulator, partial [Caldithrix sp.]|nr:response regulator [Caldithrix sp.]